MAGVPILLLAAGASSRMGGRDKLLEAVDGEPLVVRQARAAVAAGAPVVVTLPADPGGRGAALEGVPVMQVAVPDATEGMAASLRAGIAALPGDASGVLVVLADMPDLGTADFVRFLAEAPSGPDAPVLRGAAADGRAGHPVLFPRRLFPALAQLSGDSGAKSVLAAEGGAVRHLRLLGQRALTDLDTPEDWTRWRGEREA